MDDNRRREASLITLAMSGRLSQVCPWSCVARVVGEGVDGTGIKNNEGPKGTRGEGERAKSG